MLLLLVPNAKHNDNFEKFPKALSYLYVKLLKPRPHYYCALSKNEFSS